MSTTAQELRPSTAADAAAALASAAAEGRGVRFRGGGTKLGWGAPPQAPDVEISTAALNGILEHNTGDLTAVLEAGVPLAAAQERFATVGQMLALDPPLGAHGGAGAGEWATIGGVFAAGDSGPLRHRYGSPRDLVLGMQVALSDGTLARSGGKVIKNVAGYDIAKLMCGSLGTLGLIVSVSVRLQPLPQRTATALGASGDPDQLARAALALAGEPHELEAFDVAWRDGRGGLMARIAGLAPDRRAGRLAARMRMLGLEQVDCMQRDGGLWARQRAGQRARPGLAMVRISARPSRLAAVLAACESAGGTLVGRAALGQSFVELAPEAIGRVREALGPRERMQVIDAPGGVELERAAGDPSMSPALAELTGRVKDRFDPAGACAPGVSLGAI